MVDIHTWSARNRYGLNASSATGSKCDIWLLTAQVDASGPSAGKLVIGGAIISINGTQAKNGCQLLSYLAEKTLLGDNIVAAVVRGA